MKIEFTKDFAKNWKAGEIVEAKYLSMGEILVDNVAKVDANQLLKHCKIVSESEDEMGITDEIKYCKDFCPIYEAIQHYNHSHINQIFCTTEMCENICNTVDANEAKNEDKECR